MAEEARMTVADVVANVLAGEHGDFVREATAARSHQASRLGTGGDLRSGFLQLLFGPEALGHVLRGEERAKAPR